MRRKLRRAATMYLNTANRVTHWDFSRRITSSWLCYMRLFSTGRT